MDFLNDLYVHRTLLCLAHKNETFGKLIQSCRLYW